MGPARGTRGVPRRRQGAAAAVLLLGPRHRRRGHRPAAGAGLRGAGTAARVRAHPRRPDGQLRHPPGTARAAPARSPRGTGSTTGPATRTATATPWRCSPATSRSPSPAGSPPRCPRPRVAVWGRMVDDLVLGQFLDLAGAARQDRSLEVARTTTMLKSAQYTVTDPLRLGAALAGLPELPAALARYGDLVGEAFQLRDDLLGVFGDPRRTGKPVGEDLASGKPTQLLAYAAEQLPPRGQALLALAGTPALTRADVAELTDELVRCGARNRVERKIRYNVDVACALRGPGRAAAPRRGRPAQPGHGRHGPAAVSARVPVSRLVGRLVGHAPVPGERPVGPRGRGTAGRGPGPAAGRRGRRRHRRGVRRRGPRRTRPPRRHLRSRRPARRPPRRAPAHPSRRHRAVGRPRVPRLLPAVLQLAADPAPDQRRA